MTDFRNSQFRAVAIVVAGIVLAISGLRAQSALISPPALPGPAVKVNTPILGYFFDRERNRLQSVVGISGNGFPGSPLDIAAGPAIVEVSPSQAYALAVPSNTGRLVSFRLEGDIAPRPIAGTLSGITRIAISPVGAAALIYSDTDHKAQVLTGLPDTPKVTAEYDWSALPGSVTALAVSDTGDLVYVAAQREITALYAVSPASGAALAFSAPSITAVSFLRNSHDALAVAPSGNQVIWIRENAGIPNAAILLDGNSGLADPRDVAWSQDGTRAFVLDANGILSVPLSGASGVRVSCGCQASSLQRMRGRDVFLLTPSLTIADADGDELRLVQLPAEAPVSALLSGEKAQ